MGRTPTPSVEPGCPDAAGRVGPPKWWSFLAAAFLAGALAWLPLKAIAYADGPPPAHTGGFGEPSCHDCHFDLPLNDPAGSLQVAVRDGGQAELEVTVVLSRPGMKAGGFQVSARFATGDRKGEQAGTLRSVDGRVEVVEDAGSGVQYGRQTRRGTGLTAPDSVRWRLDWRPPDREGRVVFHVAANAANHDDSEFGDHIYLAEARWCSRCLERVLVTRRALPHLP